MNKQPNNRSYLGEQKAGKRAGIERGRGGTAAGSNGVDVVESARPSHLSNQQLRSDTGNSRCAVFYLLFIYYISDQIYF